MARDSEESGQEGFKDHPALKNFNRTGFMVKHVFKGLLKWGAIGLVAGLGASLFMSGAALFAGGGTGAIATGIGFLLKDVPIIGPMVRGVGSAVGGFAMNATLGLAAGGGIIGGLVGGIMAFSSASEAADAEEDRLVAKYEQQEARRERMRALERRRDEQRYAMERQADGMAANRHIPHGGRHAAMQGAGMNA